MLHALPYVAVAAIFVGLLVVLSQGRDSDPLWEQRWRDLGPADRKRIEAAVSSGALLADPEEIEIAAGLARKKKALVGFIDLASAIVSGLGVALIVAGLIADTPVLVAFGCLFLLRGLWALVTDIRIGRNLREAISRARGF
ncbi:MAG TPA: hypothetical protein VHS74_15815 [Solirubrobacterales bacterium]|nr:hypothetical protein [Solirubrobacterales bacterium]